MPASTTTTSTDPVATPFERGAVLTGLLVVATLKHALTIALLVTAWNEDLVHGRQPAPFLLLSALGALVTLVAYAGLWTGHRWALWLLAAMTVVSTLTMAMVGAPLLLQLLQVGLHVLLGAAALRRWSHFS